MTRTFDELVDHFISQVRQMKIKELDKMALIGMITMIQTEHESKRQGKWNPYNNTYVCSVCGNPIITCRTSFCPYCGARMDGGQ